MKILVISHMFPNEKDHITGIFVKEPVKELINKGHEVTVIAPVPYAPNIGKWKKYNLPLETTLEGIKVYYPRYLFLPKGKLLHLSGFFMYLGIKKLVFSLNAKYNFDLIHSHTILPDTACALLLNKKLKKTVISTIHGTDLQQSINKNKKCRDTIIKTINNCDKTILVSSKLKKILQNIPEIDINKLEVIHNGINLDKFKVEVEETLIDKYKDKKIIISIANLVKIKGHEYVLKALSEIIKDYNDIMYLIIGNGEMLESLKNLVKELHLDNYVQFLGQMKNNLALQYLQLAKIFVLPSYNEAFGVAYIEAMAYAIPIIACEGQGMSDVITHGVNGYLVKEKNSPEITTILKDLLSDENKRVVVGSMAQKLVLENYSWTKKVDEYIDVYNTVLKR